MEAKRNSTGHWIMTVEAESSVRPGGQPRIQVSSDFASSPNRPGTFLLTSTVVFQRQPPADYELILGEGYYKLHTGGRRWPEAMQVCESEGGHLMVIDTQRESNVIRELFAREPKITNAYNIHWLAVGFHDRYVSKRYETVTGQLLSDKFVNWIAGEPHGENQHCGIINKATEMAIDPCTTLWAFVCESY
ncbi:hypothetical protein R5R35_011578 [Gryllus longicercus]